MTLPRVVVEVRATLTDVGPAWRVRARLDGHEEPVITGYPMWGVAVPRGGTSVRVPRLDHPRTPPPPISPPAARAASAVDGVAVLAGLLERLDKRRPEPGDVEAYGTWLFDSLLAPAWPAICDLDEVKAARGVELALRLPPDARGLNALIWEAMYDGVRPLAAHPTLTVAITRQVPAAEADDTKPPQPLTRLPRVLMAAGSALHDADIQPGAMFMGLMRSLCAYAGVPRLAHEVSADALEEKCAEFQPDVVHLVAHGDVVEGQCVLSLRPGPSGGGETDAGTLAAALSAGGQPPLVLTLAVCGSGVPGESSTLAAELVQRGIPIVSAIAGDISEIACRLYTRKMAQAVHDGLSLAEAAARGRRAALLRFSKIDDGLDWAMPALFVDERVPPGFAIFDPTDSQALFAATARLELRGDNVFIERPGVFAPVERLFGNDTSPAPLRTVIYGSDGAIKDLGGTRLLREIGLRLLRSGHIPLLFEYPSENVASKPKRPSEVIAEIINRLLWFSQILGVPVEQATVLETYPRSAPAGGHDVRDLRNLGDQDGQERIIIAKDEFRRLPGEPNIDIAARRLAADLTAFAARMAEYGPPFGEHSRVVLLADELHGWGDGAKALLDLADREGFGQRGALIATGTYAQESPLKNFRETHRNKELAGFIFRELTELTVGEASVGFQWVLLNPWLPDIDTYARARNVDADLFAKNLLVFSTKPAIVGRPEFYALANMMAVNSLLVRNDDEKAFTAAYPGGS